jgi:hypothetical protein
MGLWSVGALAVHQSEFRDVEETDVFVGRVTADVLAESNVGIIFTEGDPQSNLDSSLAGADFRYRNTRLPGGRLLEGQMWYQQTDTEDLRGDGRAFGLGLSSPNSTGWRGGFESRQVEDNFDPAVGFVNRVGIRDYTSDFGYLHRLSDHWLQSIQAGVESYRVESLDRGQVESEVVALRLTMNSNTRDNTVLRFVTSREVLIEDFEIYSASDGSERIVIPPGDYSFNEIRAGVLSGNQRKLAGGVSAAVGDFYDGEHTSVNTQLTWRPSERFRFALRYRIDDIELPQGSFVARLSSLEAQFVFSPTLSWVNLLQYDNLSENVGINSRLHWIPEAGREGFIVFNHNLGDADKNESFHSINADVSAKFNYTWRF